MAGEWQQLSVEDITADEEGALAIGPFGSSMKADVYTEDGTPVVRGNNLAGKPGFHGDVVFVPDSIVEKFPRCIVRKDDLVFPHRGAIGEVGIVTDRRYPRWMLSTSMMKLRVNRTKAIPSFVYYFFRSDFGKHELLQNASQVGTPGISRLLTSLRECRIPLPPLAKQQQIVDVLKSLDDKIEQNRRTSAKLEELARALFRAWFVDFAPMHAKAAGATTYPSLPQAAFDALPSTFVDSKLGMIPEGWEVKSLNEIATIKSGGTPKKSLDELWDGTLSWVSPKAMTGIHVFETEQKVAEAAVGNGTKEVPRGALFVMVRGMGLFDGVRMSKATDRMTFNQDVKAIIAKHVDKIYLMFAVFCSSERLHQRVRPAGHGTGVLPTDALKELVFAIPPAQLQESCNLYFGAFDGLIEASHRESAHLATLRDYLLPRLISGQVRVRDAEVMLEDSV